MDNNNIKNIIIGVLLIGLVSMTVVYAALFQRLNVGGTANVQKGSSSWNIYFTNLSSPTIAGSASIEDGQNLRITDATTLSGLTASFSARGDSITYTFDIVNDGDVNAKINNISMPDIANASTIYTDSSDEQIVKPNLIYSLKYTSNNQDLSINDELRAHTSKTVKLTISYNSSASSLPNNDVYIQNLISQIDYIQS